MKTLGLAIFYIQRWLSGFCLHIYLFSFLLFKRWNWPLASKWGQAIARGKTLGIIIGVFDANTTLFQKLTSRCWHLYLVMFSPLWPALPLVGSLWVLTTWPLSPRAHYAVIYDCLSASILLLLSVRILTVLITQVFHPAYQAPDSALFPDW